MNLPSSSSHLKWSNDAEDQRLLVSAIGESDRVCRIYVNMIRLDKPNTTWKSREMLSYMSSTPTCQ